MVDKLSDELREAVKLSEGYRARVYKDTLDIDTIGYGFAIKDLELDEDICDMILDKKLNKLIKDVDNKFSFMDDIAVEAQDVVYEMCYQLGINGFSKFKKTIAYLRDEDYKMAAIEMLDSRWAKQTPNRAKRLSNIIKDLA
jgi:lysozyme